MEELAILDVRDLSCAVPGRILFEGLTFSVGPGGSVAVIGQSGVGKSTLLDAVLGLQVPRSGSITVCGHDMAGAPARTRTKLRRDFIGAVFQDGELFGELTAAENVALAYMLREDGGTEPLTRATELLERFGVPPRTLARDLSGGERQRVAFLRALAGEPNLIVADEPTGSLDPVTRDAVADELFRTVVERDLGLLLVTHDPEVAARADRIIELTGVPA